jgi:hypothetical protein
MPWRHGEWRLSSIIHVFHIRWRWVVSFASRPPYPQGTRSRYPLNKRLSGTHNSSERFGDGKNSSPAGIWFSAIQSLARRYTDWATRLPGFESNLSNDLCADTHSQTDRRRLHRRRSLLLYNEKLRVETKIGQRSSLGRNGRLLENSPLDQKSSPQTNMLDSNSISSLWTLRVKS